MKYITKIRELQVEEVYINRFVAEKIRDEVINDKLLYMNYGIYLPHYLGKLGDISIYINPLLTFSDLNVYDKNKNIIINLHE